MAAQSSTMEDSLSVLNPCPRLLEGPLLLHDLVAGPECEGEALDASDQNGSRLRLSYRELHDYAETLARCILRASALSASKTIIPVLIPQCPALYLSLLGILKAGAAFCPIQTDVPEDRLRFILKDVAANVILTTPVLRKKLSGLTDVKIIVVDPGELITDGQSSQEDTE